MGGVNLHTVALERDARGEWYRVGGVRADLAGTTKKGIAYRDNDRGEVTRVLVTAESAESAIEQARSIISKEMELRNGAMTRVMALTNGVRA